MKKHKFIIAIDGPAGAGKSTVAKLLAKKLGYLYIDTGAMYRSLTYKAMRKEIALENKNKLLTMMKETSLQYKKVKNKIKLFIDGELVGKEIRSPEVTRNISFIADTKAIRCEMVKVQRALGKNGGIVMEGRDIATKVFPQAEFKFYLDASAQKRAQRRYKEFLSKGVKVGFRKILQDIIMRDKKDKSRAISPLCQCPDSIVIDSTNLTPQQVVEQMLYLLGRK